MSRPPRMSTLGTPMYEVARRNPVTLWEKHYEGREREPDRTEWRGWKRAPHNKLRTCDGGHVRFNGAGEEKKQGYEIDLDRCATSDEAWGWITHLARKTWVSNTLLMDLEEALFDLGYINGFPSWARRHDPGTQEPWEASRHTPARTSNEVSRR